MDWSIRSLLNPVITRLLIYGVNPIDVEYVVSAVENTPIINGRSMKEAWRNQWQQKASKYISLANKAEQENRRQTALNLYTFATQSWYAVTLINFSNPENKKHAYLQYADLYRKVLGFSPFESERLIVELDDGSQIPGYLHLPSNAGSDPLDCVVIYSGLSSSKEEMHTLAQPLVDRGRAVFIADMPGNGESVYGANVTCSYVRLKSAFSRILDTLTAHPRLRDDGFDAVGLCMGGGYAHHAACIDARYRSCVTFFPLFITAVGLEATPRWMREGEGIKMQIGEKSAEDFLKEMAPLEAGALSCPFLFIHGKHDNWMTLEAAGHLYEKATGPKEKIIIDDAPVYSSEQGFIHTMPVGEQLHWLRHVAADWIVQQTE